MKVLVTEDGWHGRAVNPYNKKAINFDTDVIDKIYFSVENANYKEFEQTVKTYDLTEWCEPGSVLNAELVYQYQSKSISGDNLNKWFIISQYSYKSHYKNSSYNTRVAYQPIKSDTPKDLDLEKPGSEIDERKPLCVFSITSQCKYPNCDCYKEVCTKSTINPKAMSEDKDKAAKGISFSERQTESIVSQTLEYVAENGRAKIKRTKSLNGFGFWENNPVIDKEGILNMLPDILKIIK